MARSPKGRHQAPPSRALIGAATAAALLTVGGVGYGVSRHGDDKPSSTASAATSSSTGQSSGSTSSSSSSSSSSGSASSNTTTSASCRATLAAGQRLANAAAASAKDWRTHAGAQWAYDANRISYAEAQARWAASKKNGEQDLAGFASAKTAYDKVAKGCGGTTGAASGSSGASVSKACADRAGALAKLATAGTVVNNQWADHVALMKTSATAAGHEYHMKWMTQTEQAKKALRDYDSAVRALNAAPTCS